MAKQKKQKKQVSQKVEPKEVKKHFIGPSVFFQQVKSEIRRVVWPTRKETMVTTGMVFVFAFFIALFLFFVDAIIRTGLNFVF